MIVAVSSIAWVLNRMLLQSLCQMCECRIGDYKQACTTIFYGSSSSLGDAQVALASRCLAATSAKWACKMFCHCMFRATINTVSCYKFFLRRAGWQHINSVSSHDIWMAHIFYQASLMTNHHRHTGWEHWRNFNKYPLLFSCSCNHINIQGNSTRAYSAVHVQCTRASIQPCTVIWLCPS